MCFQFEFVMTQLWVLPKVDSFWQTSAVDIGFTYSDGCAHNQGAIVRPWLQSTPWQSTNNLRMTWYMGWRVMISRCCVCLGTTSLGYAIPSCSPVMIRWSLWLCKLCLKNRNNIYYTSGGPRKFIWVASGRALRDSTVRHFGSTWCCLQRALTLWPFVHKLRKADLGKCSNEHCFVRDYMNHGTLGANIVYLRREMRIIFRSGDGSQRVSTNAFFAF